MEGRSTMIELKSDEEMFRALPGSPAASRFDLSASFLINYSEELEKNKPKGNINYHLFSDSDNQASFIWKLNRQRKELFEHMERWVNTYLEEERPIYNFLPPECVFFPCRADEDDKKYALAHPEEAELKADESVVEYKFDYFREMDRNASLMSSYFIDIDNAYKQAEQPAKDVRNGRDGLLTSGFEVLLFAALAFACFWLNKHVGGLLEILPTIGTFIFGLLAVFFLMIFFSCCSSYRDDLRNTAKQADLDAAYYKVAEENIPKIHRYIRFCQLWCEAAKRPYPNKLKDLQSRLDAAIKKYNDRKAAEAR